MKIERDGKENVVTVPIPANGSATYKIVRDRNDDGLTFGHPIRLDSAEVRSLVAVLNRWLETGKLD